MIPDEDYNLLPEYQSQIFHRKVSQLLFMFTQMWRDIINIVNFSSSGSKIHMNMTGKFMPNDALTKWEAWLDYNYRYRKYSYDKFVDRFRFFSESVFKVQQRSGYVTC